MILESIYMIGFGATLAMLYRWGMGPKEVENPWLTAVVGAGICLAWPVVWLVAIPKAMLKAKRDA